MFQHHRLGIHEPLHATLHARLLASVQRVTRNSGRDAFLEAAIGEGVDG